MHVPELVAYGGRGASSGADMGRAPLRARLARHYLGGEHLPIAGNALWHLRDGLQAFPAMLDAIRDARRSVYLETYMFLDDEVGQAFARELVAAARRGAQVTVLYDAVGSWETGAGFFRRLRDQGVDARAFKPFTFALGLRRFRQRDHRKLLICDSAVAFVGGINIARHWAPSGEGRGWRDDVVRIEGPSVAHLERRFRASWWLMVRQRLRRKRVPLLATEVRGDVAVAVLSSRRTIHRAYLRAIQRARHRIVIAAAYFVPDRKLLAALRDAAERGVQVELILAGESDLPFIKYAGRALYERLLIWGVKIHEWTDCVLHSKTAVVDGVWCTVGSFNLEPQSLRFNHECNVVLADERWGEKLERSLRSDSCRARPLELASWLVRPWWEKLLERCCYVLRRILS